MNLLWPAEHDGAYWWSDPYRNTIEAITLHAFKIIIYVSLKQLIAYLQGQHFAFDGSKYEQHVVGAVDFSSQVIVTKLHASIAPIKPKALRVVLILQRRSIVWLSND